MPPARSCTSRIRSGVSRPILATSSWWRPTSSTAARPGFQDYEVDALLMVTVGSIQVTDENGTVQMDAPAAL